MRQKFIQVFFYTILAAGTAFLAYSINSIAKTEYSISQIMSEMPIDARTNRALADTKPTRQSDFDKTDFDVRTMVDSQIFSDRHLRYEITPTDDHFTFNEVLSADGGKIAYAELSDCAGRTHQYASSKNMPGCAWDYSIKILYRDSGAIITALSDNGNENNLAGVALIYHPYAWTKGGNNLIVTWSNIGLGGRSGAPSEYSIIDLANNKVIDLGYGNNQVVFSHDFETAVTVNAGKLTNVCDEEIQAAPNAINITNLTTGETKTLVSEKNALYHISSFDRETNKLTYQYRVAKNATDCDRPGPNDKKKTIEAVF